MVDFPGVDDEDDTIGDLADLLLTIAQIVLFVVDYRCVGGWACVNVHVCSHDHVCMCAYISLAPRPRKKGLIHTVCACANKHAVNVVMRMQSSFCFICAE